MEDSLLVPSQEKRSGAPVFFFYLGDALRDNPWFRPRVWPVFSQGVDMIGTKTRRYVEVTGVVCMSDGRHMFGGKQQEANNMLCGKCFGRQTSEKCAEHSLHKRSHLRFS